MSFVYAWEHAEEYPRDYYERRLLVPVPKLPPFDFRAQLGESTWTLKTPTTSLFYIYIYRGTRTLLSNHVSNIFKS